MQEFQRLKLAIIIRIDYGFLDEVVKIYIIKTEMLYLRLEKL